MVMITVNGDYERSVIRMGTGATGTETGGHQDKELAAARDWQCTGSTAERYWCADLGVGGGVSWKG